MKCANCIFELAYDASLVDVTKWRYEHACTLDKKAIVLTLPLDSMRRLKYRPGYWRWGARGQVKLFEVWIYDFRSTRSNLETFTHSPMNHELERIT